MGLVRGEQGGGRQSQSGRGGVTDIGETCGPWQFIHGNTAKRNLFGNDSVLCNTVPSNCKPCGHDGLAPKNYFHGRCRSRMYGIAATTLREIVASPSGSSARWLPRDAFAHRRCQRVAESHAPERPSEVRIQTMGCLGDSAPKIISGSSCSCNTCYSYYGRYSHIS